MTKFGQKAGRWQPGQSGNVKGRPRKGQALTELLRLAGETMVVINGVEKMAHEALAEAVWQFVITGRVVLNGKELVAESVTEWANVVKWLYSYLEPANQQTEAEQEMVVRVIRVDRGEVDPESEAEFDAEPEPLDEETEEFPAVRRVPFREVGGRKKDKGTKRGGKVRYGKRAKQWRRW